MSETAPEQPSFAHAAWSGLAGIATADVTPPLGVYSRCWGAAEHDVANAIHRPLTVTAVTLRADEDSTPLVYIDADLGWWQTLETFQEFQASVLKRFSLEPENFLFGLTHTHASPPLAKLDPNLPGQADQQRWLDQLQRTLLDVIRASLEDSFAAQLDWQTGQCGLATNRDLEDPAAGADRVLCGFDPHAAADKTLLVGRLADATGKLRGVLVNYACHPTTLAWENQAISPDYLGAMRETITRETGADAIFMQGASGDLAPRYQYVADCETADRHGRQLAYAALSTLENMEPIGKRLTFQGVVESGAPLAVWRHAAASPSTQLRALRSSVEVPLKDWPSAAELERQRLACRDRALAERLRRKRDIRIALGDDDTFTLPIWAWKIGDAILIGSMAESYSVLQTEIRRRFPEQTILCLNLVNGSIGYLCPAALYHLDIYPVMQTPFDLGALELTIEAMTDLVRQISTPAEATHVLQNA
ncbi:MAG: alkaline ceramidase [Blastopirellula sp. JB062]